MNRTDDPRLNRWHDIVFNRDLAGLGEMLADDVIFRSPYVWRPYVEREATWLILSTVLDVFRDFAYHRELIDGDNWALEFRRWICNANAGHSHAP